jgi:hypothetical protein
MALRGLSEFQKELHLAAVEVPNGGGENQPFCPKMADILPRQVSLQQVSICWHRGLTGMGNISSVAMTATIFSPSQRLHLRLTVTSSL